MQDICLWELDKLMNEKLDSVFVQYAVPVVPYIKIVLFTQFFVQIFEIT